MSHTENEASSGKETAEDPKGAADVSEAEMGCAGRGGKPSANEAGSPAGKRNGSGTARPAVILGGAVAFLVGCDSMVVAPIAPEILESWGASASLSALLVAAYALAYAATSPFFGALADYRGRRPVAVAGLAVFGAGTALTFAAPNLGMGLACRALAGLGAGMVMPTVFGEVVSRSTPQTRGANVGVVTGMLLSATVVGVPIGSLLASAVGWQWTFLLIAIPGFLAMFPAVRVFSGVVSRKA
ncbi:MAG: MFS transporter, partial [Peptidiphaga gingivicola]